jgi:pyruvate,water dikinase
LIGHALVLDLNEIDRLQVAVVGGKGANLGELSRIESVSVPPGFCVTTHAYARIVAGTPLLDDQLVRLSALAANDRGGIRALSAEIRATLERVAMPDILVADITRALARHGERFAYAVRSSATVEDQPTASFAGQHDSYLNVAGAAAIVRSITLCWASLFTERAITYRLRNGIDHRAVQMAVVVQRMVDARASGILFTADPLTGYRKVASIEATAGPGEALVSGHVNADAYTVRGDSVVDAQQRQAQRVLTNAQAVRLAQIGRRIEAHFGRPQDIEWCLADDDFQIVQSRPITTLFPVPQRDDTENHVYVSVGHQQMMTDAMKPLGVSFRKLTAATTFHEAGGRVFVDVTRALASPATRAGILMLGKSDPLIGDALRTIVDRGDFLPAVADAAPVGASLRPAPDPIEIDPAIPAELIARSEASVALLERELRTLSGPALLAFISADFAELKRQLTDPRSSRVFMSAMEAAWWLNDKLLEWLGEKNASDTLTRSVPNNITSEMGLALLDVADAIRPHPEVVAFLEQVDDESFLDELPPLDGGREARDAIMAWLGKYGMRGVGEIDITRPRWSERPSMLVPLLLGNIRNFEAGEARRHFERGRLEASKKEAEILERLRALTDGERKAGETKRMIDRVRTFIGYREYPKYGMMCRYWAYKQALMAEARRLVQEKVLREAEDVFWLTFEELQDVVRTHRVDEQLIRERQAEFRSFQALIPPRVLTSDGEMVAGTYRRGDVPAGALVGFAVSAGTVEGRARVILDLTSAELAPGDILVTAFTDPSWTPLFVAVAGLVTEVGGLMTHGAVIAREYGLPAVVGVEHATRLIRDGQRIRVHGTDGYVEILA